MQVFKNDLEGAFVERPNRYLVGVSTGLGIVEAHCPNPGRMAEILLPGTPIILERAQGFPEARKTEWTAVAAIHRDQVVPLDAHRANKVARTLILPRLFPDAQRIAAEQRLGSGRVDFVVEQSGQRTNVEVKSCTLVEHGVAMFPDAPSDRATRHLRELEIATRDPEGGESVTEGVVLFVIAHSNPRVFTPNIHTDPVFAKALRQTVGGPDSRVGARAASVAFTRAGVARLVDLDVDIDLGPVDLVDIDGGGYVLIIRVDKPETLMFGKHNSAALNAGYYVYVGSAVRGLSARLARHHRKRKKHHWHIDDLLCLGSLQSSYPILAPGNIENELALDIGAVADGSIPGFGASDSPLPSHLFYFATDPYLRRDFVDVVFRHRHLDIF